MPTAKVIEHSVMDYGRDAAGLGFTVVATGAFREIGAVAGIIIAPKIAKTEFGKKFNVGIAILALVDSLLVRFTGTNYGSVV